MSQQKKAEAVLDHLFLQPRYARAGVSETFLREYAGKKWVGKDEPLQAAVLVEEAEARTAKGSLLKFHRAKTTFYKLP